MSHVRRRCHWRNVLKLELALVRAGTDDGCAVELLNSGQTIEAAFAAPVRDQIRIRRGQLVAIDRANPPRIVFRWFLGTVEEVAGDRVGVVRRDGDGKVLAPEGQKASLIPVGPGLARQPVAGDEVFFGGMGERAVIAIASRGRPQQIDGFEAAFPAIAAYYAGLD